MKTNDELAAEVEDRAAPMDLSWEGQRAYAVRLGLVPDGDREAWWENRDAQDVSRLMEAMRQKAGKMASAKSWMLSSLADNDRRMTGREIHSVGHLDGLARHGLEYDEAKAAYVALEEQLASVVNRIRREQGYEPSAFARLEDHPTRSAEDERVYRELRKLEEHLRGYEASRPGTVRQHLTGDHGHRPAASLRNLTTAQLADLHETTAHGEFLATLRGRVAAIEAAEAEAGKDA